MKITKFQDNIILVHFDIQQELTETLLRPQEFYESPEFAGKVFDLAEYATWYKTTKEHGQFSYYTDWAGFNIPQRVIKNFLIKYTLNSTLYQLEKRLFKALDDNNFFDGDEGYMIAVYGTGNEATIRHELVHATYSVDPSYRTRVNSILGWHLDPKLYRDLANQIRDMGYGDNVIDDEMNAYLIDLHEDGEFRFKLDNMDKYKEIAERLAAIYSHHKRQEV